MTGPARFSKTRKSMAMRPGSIVASSVALATALLWSGCNVEDNYETLSFFFDGVPSPSAMRAESDQEAGPGREGSWHTAYIDRRCSECHGKTARFSFAVSGFTELDATVCLKCHEQVPTEYPLVHGPVAVGECLVCHQPHQSPYPKLLIQPSPELCLYCHSEDMVGEPVIPEHRDVSRDCLECHHGHGGADPYFLRPAIEPVPTEDPAAAPASAFRPAPTSAPNPAQAPRRSNPSLAMTSLGAWLVGTRRHCRGATESPAGSAPGRCNWQRAMRGSPSCRRSPRATPLLVAGAISIPVGAGLAQDQGPVVVTQQLDLQSFTLEQFDAALEFEYRWQTDGATDANGRSRETTEHRFREILELDGVASIAHPNLFELSFNTQFWFTQYGGDISTDNIFLFLYDFRAHILKEQKLNFTLYTRRNQTDVDRQFGGSLLSNTEEYGAVVNLRSEVIPTTVTFYRQTQDQEDPLSISDFFIDRDSVDADGQVLLGTSNTSWWTYMYDDITQSGGGGPISFKRHQGNFDNLITFGADEQHSLRSGVFIFNQTGDFEQQQLRWSERLRFEHSESFRTWYESRLQFLNRPDFEQRSWIAAGNFRHQLYDSLTTTGRIGASHLDIPTDDFNSQEIFAELVSDYVKTVPYGVLDLGGEFVWSHGEDSDRGSVIPIFDESLTFNLADMAFLEGQNILTDTIVVTDASGVVVYSEGLDYIVEEFPGGVEITRLPGSAIPDQSKVLVDYDIGPVPGGTRRTLGWGMNGAYTFDEGLLRGLSVYARYFQQDEDLDPVLPDSPIPNSFTNLVYGAGYDFWKINLSAERQQREGELAPFDSTRLEGRFVERFGSGNALVLTAWYQDLNRLNPGVRDKTLTLSARWVQQFTDRLRGSVLFSYRNTNDNAGRDSEAFDGEINLLWQYRQTSIYARYRASFVDSNINDTRFQRLTMGIRREF